MTETVYKFTADSAQLRNEGRFALSLPAGARVVLAGMQHDLLCLWAIVDPEATLEWRDFMLRGTGHAIPPNATHIHSFTHGVFVWHVFELDAGIAKDMKG